MITPKQSCLYETLLMARFQKTVKRICADFWGNAKTRLSNSASIFPFVNSLIVLFTNGNMKTSLFHFVFYPTTVIFSHIVKHLT